MHGSSIYYKVLTPVLSVQGTVLNGFRNIITVDLFPAFEIGNGARDLQYAVKDAGGIAHFINGILQESMAITIQHAMLAQHFAVHLAVIEDAGFGKTLVLNLTSAIDPAPDRGRGISRRQG